MLYGLTMEDLKRIDKEEVRKIIQREEERLITERFPKSEKEQIREEIRELKKLL